MPAHIDTKDLCTNSKKLVKEFGEWLANILDFAPRTISRYQQVIARFANWVQTSTSHHSLTSVTENDIAAFKDYERPKHEGSGIEETFAILRAFFMLAKKKGRISNVPISEEFRIRTIIKQHIEDTPTLSQFLEMRRMINNPVISKHNQNIDHAQRGIILECMASTGMRIGTILSLTPSQIRWENNSIIVDPAQVKVKKGRGYEARMSPYFSRLLKRWIDERNIGERQILFSEKEANIRVWLHKMAPSDKWVLSPHAFRRFFCCLMYYRNYDMGEKDLLWVAFAVGHNCYDTTMKYARSMNRVVDLRNRNLTDALWTAFVDGTEVSVPAITINTSQEVSDPLAVSA